MSKTFRRATAALLVTLAAFLTGAAPSHAASHSARRGSAERAWIQPVQSFLLAVLTEILDCAGGAMDPNGRH
jgi:hypothetical protein